MKYSAAKQRLMLGKHLLKVLQKINKFVISFKTSNMLHDEQISNSSRLEKNWNQMGHVLPPGTRDLV
jgi:hypothetical protein